MRFSKRLCYCYIDGAIYGVLVFRILYLCRYTTVFTGWNWMKWLLQSLKLQIPVEAFAQTFYMLLTSLQPHYSFVMLSMQTSIITLVHKICKMENIDGLALSIDFEKLLIWMTEIVSTMVFIYLDLTSILPIGWNYCIHLKRDELFEIKRGVRQGCPLSMGVDL